MTDIITVRLIGDIMSYGLKNEKGFIRNHQIKREHYYYNTHSSANKMDQHKALLHDAVHKKSGWSRGLNAKQFDVSRLDYCKKFRTKKSIADLIYLPHGCWGFGRKHIGLKFSYRP